MSESHEDTTCPICQDSVMLNVLCRLERCGHCFHVSCVSRWLRASPTCPMCRVEVNPHVIWAHEYAAMNGADVVPVNGAGVVDDAPDDEVPNYRPQPLVLAARAERSAEDEARFRVALEGLEAAALLAWNIKQYHERYGATVNDHKLFYARWCWAYRRSVRYARHPENASNPAHPDYVDLGAVFVAPPAPPLPPLPEWMRNRPSYRHLFV